MARLRHAALSDTGLVRSDNEDRWCAEPSLGLFVVADGIVGNFGGQIAAASVVETLPRLVREMMDDFVDLTSPEARELLLAAICTLSDEIRRQGKEEFGLEGMGATLALSLVRSMRALIAHMGDNRAYLQQQNRFEQLTKDHTIVQILLDMGEITPLQAAYHPARSHITRFAGMPLEPLPESCLVQLPPGDRLLLCSDGLTDMVSDAQIAAILNKERLSLTRACRRLVDAANAAGGRDNITVLIIDVSAGSC